jgi:hypothetical protein
VVYVHAELEAWLSAGIKTGAVKPAQLKKLLRHARDTLPVAPVRVPDPRGVQ